MAKFVLANRIVFDGILLRPGKIVDDSAYDTTRMTVSGAILIATPNAIVEARALAIRTAQSKGETGEELDLLSAASSESGGGGGGGVPAGRTLTAGTGLTGGGDLSADRTFAIGTIPFANVAAALLLASASINVNSQKIVSLLDPTNPQDAATKAYVDANSVPSARTITAGTGLSGGGDLSANRTISIGVLPFANVNAAIALANASINVNSQKIVSLLDPTNPQDAATKAYVDAHAGGGGGAVPTGTGFYHVTGGVMDVASVAVNLASADVTGILASANMAAATAGATGAVQLAGDLGGTGTAAATPRVGALTGIGGTIALATTAAIVQWVAGAASPTIKQAIQGSDIATNSLTISAQAPFVGSTGTNRTPGSLILSVPAPDGAGANGKISLTLSGTERMAISQSGASAIIQFVSPSGTAQSYFGSGAGGTLSLTFFQNFISASDATFIYAGNGLSLGTSGLTSAQRFGGGFYVVYQANASTLPTTNPTTGHIWYSDGGCPAYRTSAGNVMKWDGISAATANAGAGGALPATISEYMTITYNGNTRKIPLYLT